MRRAPVRLLAPVLVVPLLLLTACGSGAADETGRSSDVPTTTPGTDEPVDEESTPPQWHHTAAPATFCAVMQEIDASIDEGYAAGGDPDDAWARIIAAFDAIDESGIPATVPAAAVEELAHIDRLVHQSTSLEDYDAALAADQATGRALDGWLSANCR